MERHNRKGGDRRQRSSTLRPSGKPCDMRVKALQSGSYLLAVERMKLLSTRTFLHGSGNFLTCCRPGCGPRPRSEPATPPPRPHGDTARRRPGHSHPRRVMPVTQATCRTTRMASPRDALAAVHPANRRCGCREFGLPPAWSESTYLEASLELRGEDRHVAWVRGEDLHRTPGSCALGCYGHACVHY